MAEIIENNNSMTCSAKDLNKLLGAMAGYGDGIFDEIDVSEFDDPAIGRAFNDMIGKAVKRNNRILARINDAQLRIGDTSCLKQMFEQITAQEDAIRMLQESREEITPDDRPLANMDKEFLAMSQQIANSVKPCLDAVGDSLEILEQLDIPVRDQWSLLEEKEDPIWEKLRNLRDNMNSIYERLASVDRRVDTMADDAVTMFGIIEKKGSLSKNFLDGVDSLTLSYKNLSADCLDTGRHLYRISRDIDNARNDIFRHFSRPTLHDRLSVYEVDHVTLAWRLYNNIVEFESLKITQINNPKTCKLGLWIEGMEDETILNHESFKNLKIAHNKLHDAAVECFEAKQNYDIVLALDKFGEVMDALAVFQNAISSIHEFLRENGDDEETDVWKFRG